jgi:hypothetical protein
MLMVDNRGKTNALVAGQTQVIYIKFNCVVPRCKL